MNAQCYRVIFSKTLQRPVVVSELSKTAGKTNTLSRGDFICSSKFISFTKVSKIRPLFFSLWYALGFITFADNALADLRIQADPTANANQQPIVLETANGIPQVNIQTPNDKGLSHNRYQSFDVDTQGAILNNSHKNVSTQLGGMVQGNPYLAAGEAKVILNEVNSDRPSELKGYVEVAGKKADVIIANPSGLYCEGCGVINAERATLTTGKVEIENGELRSFKVEKGKITVSGRGLDASQVDYADIIARETEINAGIWAKKQINVTTGKNRVAKNNDSLEIIHDSDNSDNSDSQTDAVTGYAVDVLSLGGMYAEKIHLIGTEAGMGVRNAGHIGASAGQAVINSEGKIVNSGIINAERSVQLTTKSAVLNNGVLDSQQQHIQVTAQADIKQNGTVIARHGNVNFTTAKSIAQNGTTLAQGNISYQAETIQATANATLAAGMKDDLTLDERSNNGKNITLSATGRVSVQGENLASNRLTVSGQTVDLSHGRTTANHVQLTASSDKINLDNSRIAAQQRFVAVTPTTLSTRSAQIDAGQFSITASQLDNTLGTLASRTNAAFDLTLPNGINNTQGQIYGAGNLVFNTSSLQNRQGIILGQSVDLNITDLQNADGKILSKSDLTAITQTFNNTDGSVVAQNALDIQSTSLNNANGTVFAVGNAAVKAENVNNTQQGRIVSQSNLTLTALAVDNQGGFIQGQNTTIDTTQLNNNATDGTGSLIGAVRQLAIKAQFIANQYTKATATTPTQGLQAQKIALNSTALSNKNGGIYAENSISISLDSQLNNQQGEILAADALTIHQNSNQLMVDNAEGQIEAGRNLGIYAKGITNQGNITTTGNATIALQDSYTLNKAFTAGENLSFSTQGNFINTVQQVVNNALTIYARNIENQNGAELSSKATTLQTGTLTNRGLIDGTENVIQADTVDNIGTGRIYGNHLAIEAKQINNQAETVNNSTSAATIAARERLDLGVGTLINRDHSLILSLSEMAIGGSLDKQQRAAGKANLIDNGSATIEALGNGTINTANLFNHDLYLTTQVVNTTEYVHEMALTGDSQRYRVGVEGSFDWGGRSAWFDFYDERETLIQKEWYGWKYNRTTSTTQIATQDPGLMTFGGNLTLNGDNLRNQYSKLLVGNTLILGDTAYTQNTDNGTLSAGNVTLVNEDLKQQINVTETGYSYFLQHYRKHGRNGHRETNEVRFNISKPTQEADFGVVQNIIGNTSVISENTVDRNVAARSDAADTAVTSVQLTTLNTTGDNAQIADGSITIKTVTPMVTLPQASLYRINPSADSHYLVETDPKFTDVGQWLSSDYMFNALRYEPTAMLKRLGDGYYEQRLVNEQINQLTGYRYLTGYQSDYEQYKALMDNGIKYAEQFDLTPGVALTEAQMKELTTDLVWFVNQNVTLTDGSTVSVLVPRVYLVARNTDITQDGGLISANHIIATGSGNIENSGVIAGRALTALTATSISNLGGTLRGQTLLLNATQNLNNLGGRLLADTRLFAKAKTINIASTTAENIDDGNFYQKALNRVADVTVSNTQGEGLLVLQSEEDITVKGADMTVNGTTIINAGGNLNLTTLETVNKEHYTADSNNYYHLDQSKEVGNNLTLNGNATLQAANNITVRNSNITAEKQLNLIANHGDINITSGREKESLATARKWNSHGLLSKTTSISKYEHHYDTSTGSNISGEGIILAAEKGNVAVTGSSVVANHSLSMQAGNDVTVTADTNTVKTYSYSESKKSGLMGTGGIGFTIGTKKQSDEYKTYAVTQSDAASAVGSLGGDVAILSGNKATVLGSDMIAPTDNTITVQAKSLSVEAGQDIIATDETHVVKQSGLTLALSTPVTDSLLEANRSIKRGGQVSNDKLKALYGIKAATEMAMAADNLASTLDTLGNMSSATYDPSAAGNANVKLSLSVGASQSKRESHGQQISHNGSSLSAGNVSLSTTEGDLNVAGSNVTATNRLTLASARDINLTATQDSDTYNSSNKNSGWSAGVFVGYNGNSYGFGFEASGQVGKGKENSETTTQTNSRLNAAQVELTSANDTTLRGATVNATGLTADIGNDLTIESLQDSGHYDAKQTQSGAEVSIAYGSGGSGAVNFSQSKARMNYAQVAEQSGFNVGDGGMDVNVANNTRLKGGLIQSTATEDKNRFTTNSLSAENIENYSEAKAQSVSAGFSSGGINPLTAATTLMSALSGVDKDSHSTTRSAIGGNIQLAVKSGELDTALSRDTANSNDKVDNYDIRALKEKVDENAEMARVIGEISNNLVNLAWKEKLDKAEAEKAEAKAVLDNKSATTEEKLAAAQSLQQANKVITTYGKGGDYQMAIRAVTGVLQGLASGNTGAAIAGGLSPYANLAIKNATTNENGEVNTSASVMAHAILGAIEARISNSNVAAGAVAGGGGELMANVIAKTLYGVDGTTKTANDLTEAQKNTITVLSQLAGGLAGGLLGDSTQSAVLSSEVSKRAVENNALWQKDIYHYREDLIEAIKEGKDLQEIHDYYKSLSERQREELLADCGADCRLPMKNLLEGATDLADDLTGVINTWLSNLPESEQTKFYQLIESENQKTINALSEKQGLSEDLVEKGLLGSSLLSRESLLGGSSAIGNGFAKKVNKQTEINRKISTPVLKTDVDAAKIAKELGYVKTNYRTKSNAAVFKKGNSYITRDVDGHNGGAWKEASSPEKLNKKETRNGTFDINLNRIGD